MASERPAAEAEAFAEGLECLRLLALQQSKSNDRDDKVNGGFVRDDNNARCEKTRSDHNEGFVPDRLVDRFGIPEYIYVHKSNRKRKSEFVEDSSKEEITPTQDDVLLDQHDSSQSHFRDLALGIAKQYKRVKRSFKWASLDIISDSIEVQGGRFLEKDNTSGGWRPAPVDAALAQMQRDFRHACKDFEKAHKKDIGPPRYAHQRQNAVSTDRCSPPVRHCCVDMTRSDSDSIFSLAMDLITNSPLQSLELILHDVNLCTASVLAWTISANPSLEQVKLSFPPGKYEDYFCPIILNSCLQNPSIKTINLDGNGIRGSVCKKICKLILGAPTTCLERLALNDNCIGDRGVRALVRLIQKNCSLQCLSLHQNGLSQGSLDLLLDAARAKTPCLFEISGTSMDSQEEKMALLDRPHVVG